MTTTLINEKLSNNKYIGNILSKVMISFKTTKNHYLKIKYQAQNIV